MHSQRHCLHNSFIPFSSRPIKPGHAAQRRALSVSAAQADTVVREKRGKCQPFHTQHLPAVLSARKLMPSHARELCPHIGRKTLQVNAGQKCQKLRAVQPG